MLRTRRRQVAVDRIAGWIVGGRFAPGDTLPVEPAMGDELAVSRTVVREALKMLTAKGMVVTGPRVGTRVRPRSAWNHFDPDVVNWRLEAGVDAAFVRDLMELRLALEPFARIRRAVGDRMDIMVEFHSLWSLPMAKKLAERLAEFDTYWHEDPFRLDNIGDLADYARHSKAWVCASKTLAYTHSFREYLQTGVAGVAMLDLAWCGGLTEARKIAALAGAGTSRSRRTTARAPSSTRRRATCRCTPALR